MTNRVELANNFKISLLGTTEHEAVTLLEKSGLSFHIARRDAEYFLRIMNYNPTRVNISIDKGYVTKVDVG